MCRASFHHSPASPPPLPACRSSTRSGGPPPGSLQHGAHRWLDDACRAAQAAHSTVRALYKSYAGPLYQVKRKDGKTMDIKVSEPGGFADAATQDKFCAGSSCVFFQLYDQSPQGNHLGVAPGGGAHRQEDIPANAAADPLMVGGHKVYGLRMDPPSGYRRDNTSGIAVHDEPETIYAVFNGSHYNNRCCFDCEPRLLRRSTARSCVRAHAHTQTPAPCDLQTEMPRQTTTTTEPARWKHCILGLPRVA